MTEFMMQAYHVLDEIKKDPVYQEIKRLDHFMVQTYAEEIDQFQKAKAHYDQIMSEGGAYHPDFKEAVKSFQTAKLELYSKEEVKTYFELEKQFQDDLNTFLNELSSTVSAYIKAPDKMGIIKKGGSCHVR